jgi:hypothetical protein
VIRFQIRLDETSFQILHELAEREYRDLRYQAALLIRESLQRRGLLATQDQQEGVGVMQNQKVKDAR